MAFKKIADTPEFTVKAVQSAGFYKWDSAQNKDVPHNGPGKDVQFKATINIGVDESMTLSEAQVRDAVWDKIKNHSSAKDIIDKFVNGVTYYPKAKSREINGVVKTMGYYMNTWKPAGAPTPEHTPGVIDVNEAARTVTVAPEPVDTTDHNDDGQAINLSDIPW